MDSLSIQVEMEGSLHENDDNHLEECVKKVITKIRANRNRACLQNVHNFVNRRGVDVDMPKLTETIDNLCERNIIINKGKEGTESYYLIQDENNSELSNEKNIDEISDEGIILNDVKEFIDNKFYSTIIDRIKHEVKNELKNVLNLNELNVSTPKVIQNDSNDILINTLKSEIEFLRNDILSKDKIIEMLIKEKPRCNQVEHSNEQIHLRNTNLNVKKAVTNNNELLHDEVKINSEVKNNRKKRSTVILGDSLLKDIEQHKIRKGLGNNDKVYVKQFSGANIEHMKSYVIPSKSFDNDLVILHVGTNDLREKKTAKEIATNIIDLAIDMKTDKNDIMVSGIILRKDEYNVKGLEVNSCLVSLCSTYKFNFIDNSNISVNHLNKSGLHLNYNGTYVLGGNLVDAIRL